MEPEGNRAKGTQDNEEDLEHFMQQVEGDKEMRQNMNLYKKKANDKKKAQVATEDEGNAMDEDGEYDDEEVRLEELLDDMSLHSDLEDNEEEEDEEEDNEDEQEQDDSNQEAPPVFDTSAFDPAKFKFV